MAEGDRIFRLHAIEILDSRGRPTIQTTCQLQSGVEATVSVPSGASTGSSEAHELRDGDPHRYGGWGVRAAVTNVNDEIGRSITTRGLGTDQEPLDRMLIELDGTPTNRASAQTRSSRSLWPSREPRPSSGAALLPPIREHDRTNCRRSAPAAADRQPLQRRQARRRPDSDSGCPDHAAHSPNADDAMAQISAVYQARSSCAASSTRCARWWRTKAVWRRISRRSTLALGDAVAAIERRRPADPAIDIALCLDVASSHFYRTAVSARRPAC